MMSGENGTYYIFKIKAALLSACGRAGVYFHKSLPLLTCDYASTSLFLHFFLINLSILNTKNKIRK